MLNSERLQEFVSMWGWLSAHPVNDRDYYLKYVAKGPHPWANDCPLADREGSGCSGCHTLWESGNGNLCTDGDSPLRKWREASFANPDLRVYYASEVGALGVQAIRVLRESGAMVANG